MARQPQDAGYKTHRGYERGLSEAVPYTAQAGGVMVKVGTVTPKHSKHDRTLPKSKDSDIWSSCSFALSE